MTRNLLLACILGFSVLGGSARGASPSIAFEISHASLSEAALALSRTLHRKIVLDLFPSSPARKRLVSLSMTAEEPEDILTAVAAAFGVRWLPRTQPGEVLFVEKTEYCGTAPAMRQALVDAVPVEYRDLIRPYVRNALAIQEAPLKRLTEDQKQQLLKATADGPVPVNRLPPDLARSLLLYLNAYSYARLGTEVDWLARDVTGQNATVLVQYGRVDPTQSEPQFTIMVRGRSLAVIPE